jgi:hypothetical protein
MFARPTFGNQFQPFAFGASPFSASAGFGGISPFAPQIAQIGGYNPLLQFLTPQLNPVGAFGGYSPVHPQIGNYGFNPYQATQTAGPTPLINPLVAAQLAAINPTILPYLLQQILAQTPPQTLPQSLNAASGPQWGQASPFGQQVNPGHPGLINPLLQPIGIEASYFGQSPFGNVPGQFGPLGQIGQPGQFGWNNVAQGLTPFQGSINPFVQSPFGQSLTGGLPTQTPYYNQFSPFATQDPVTATLLAQQRLPIRPLAGQQQVDPYQLGLSGITGLMGNQSVDPYSTLAQAQLLAQCAVNPLQQMGRTYSLGNWAGSPYSMGQTSPINPIGQAGPMGQTGVPFNF